MDIETGDALLDNVDIGKATTTNVEAGIIIRNGRNRRLMESQVGKGKKRTGVTVRRDG